MFDPSFYTINESFDGNLTSYVSFQPNLDYLVRFVVDGWETSQPDGERLKRAAKSLSTVMAEVGDLSLYEIKSVAFQKIASGEKVGYYSSWYTVSLSRGYTDTFTAGDGTWAMDLVFRPKSAERSWTSVQKWTQILSGNLVGSRGAPRVFCAGLITLDPSVTLSNDVFGIYLNAVTFWSSRYAFWEAFGSSSEVSSTGKLGDVRQINEPPLPGWTAFPPYAGQDGLGIASGSAMTPHLMAPLAVAGTVSSEPVVTQGDPDLPPVGAPPAPNPALVTWQTLSESQKVGAVISGVAVVTLGVFAWRLWQNSRY